MRLLHNFAIDTNNNFYHENNAHILAYCNHAPYSCIGIEGRNQPS